MPDDSRPKPSTPLPAEAERWRELACKASREPDPVKLSELVRELCDELDLLAAKRNAKKPCQSDDPAKPLDTRIPHA